MQFVRKGAAKRSQANRYLPIFFFHLVRKRTQEGRKGRPRSSPKASSRAVHPLAQRAFLGWWASRPLVRSWK